MKIVVFNLGCKVNKYEIGADELTRIRHVWITRGPHMRSLCLGTRDVKRKVFELTLAHSPLGGGNATQAHGAVQETETREEQAQAAQDLGHALAAYAEKIEQGNDHDASSDRENRGPDACQLAILQIEVIRPFDTNFICSQLA